MYYIVYGIFHFVWSNQLGVSSFCYFIKPGTMYKRNQFNGFNKERKQKNHCVKSVFLFNDQEISLCIERLLFPCVRDEYHIDCHHLPSLLQVLSYAQLHFGLEIILGWFFFIVSRRLLAYLMVKVFHSHSVKLTFKYSTVNFM